MTLLSYSYPQHSSSSLHIFSNPRRRLLEMKKRDVHVCGDTQPAALASPGPNGPVIRPARCRRRAECRMHTAPSSLALLHYCAALLACICHFTACKKRLCGPDTAAGSHDFSCLPPIDSPSPPTWPPEHGDRDSCRKPCVPVTREESTSAATCLLRLHSLHRLHRLRCRVTV